jgi:hypothetical protein
MLVVKIELWPFGDPTRAKTLATGMIANTGAGTPTRGDYRVLLRDAAGRPWKSGTVESFPRKRLLAWDLLFRALRNLIADRNREPVRRGLTPTTVETRGVPGSQDR